MLRDRYTRLTFKARLSRKVRTRAAHLVSQVFPVRQEADALIVRHSKDDYYRVAWLFMLNHRVFTQIA